MSEKINLNDLWPVIEEKIKNGAEVTINPGGKSMLPLIKPGRDSAVLIKLPDKLKKYDVVLYRRKSGMFVLHRIIGTKNGKYVMRGDNEYMTEYGIEPEKVLAYMVSVIRNKRQISVKSFKYRLYAVIRVKIQSLKRLIMSIKRRIFKV